MKLQLPHQDCKVDVSRSPIKALAKAPSLGEEQERCGGTRGLPGAAFPGGSFAEAWANFLTPLTAGIILRPSVSQAK